jgi:hypothetical protein
MLLVWSAGTATTAFFWPPEFSRTTFLLGVESPTSWMLLVMWRPFVASAASR